MAQAPSQEQTGPYNVLATAPTSPQPPAPNLAVVPPPDHVDAEPIDLSDILVMRRNWRKAGIQVRSGSGSGTATKLAVQPFMDLCSDIGTATTKAEFLDIHLLKDGTGNIAGVPATEMGKNTLRINWSKGGATFHIDFSPLFTKRPFPMPEQTRAHLPVEFTTVKGIGKCMVIHFNRADFARIEVGSRPRKKKNTEGQGQQAAGEKK